MKQVNILLRALRSIRSFFKPSSMSESDIKHNGYNGVLAKWEDHYRTHPNEFSFRCRHSTRNYLTPAD